MSKRRHPSSAAAEITDEPGDTPMAPSPPSRSGSLTRELEIVEARGLSFYEAFESRDIRKMAALWTRSPYMRCIHPGWEPVVGWPSIRQSWMEIFDSMNSIEFTLGQVQVEVMGNTAWVNLVAHAEVATDEDSFSTAVVATTIFEKTEGNWFIVLHHSSHYVEDDELEDDDLELNGGFGGSSDGQPN